MQITSGDMPMLSDLQLVYMGPRNSIQLLKINTTKFQVEREPVYIIFKYWNSEYYQLYNNIIFNDYDKKKCQNSWFMNFFYLI